MKSFLRISFSVSLIIFSFIILVSCSDRKEFKITVTNPTEQFITDGFVTAKIDSSFDSFSLFDGENEIPYQLLNSDEEKIIGFVVNLDSMETKTLKIKKVSDGKIPEFKSRTYAELSMKPRNIYIDKKFRGDKFVNVTKIKVPAIHTDHDALFRYEGPGWESEKVGYRFYLDWRNANDIFGKKVNKLLLANVGVHDTVAQDDSYHSMLDWGMDIFNVGKSLGIGSIGMWNGGKVNMVSKTDSVFCEITENGPVRSSIKTSYFGWQVGEKKYDLVSTLSINAGSRMTKCEIEISDNPENIVTGLAKYEGTDFIRNNGNGGWGYIALYGKQTLVNPDDELGIAVFYKKNNLIEFAEDDLSYIIKLKPENGKVEYYFCAAWDQEPDGIKNRNDFLRYLDNKLEQLNHPLVIKVD
jgi:Domain of unknown function (DUF4861)